MSTRSSRTTRAEEIDRLVELRAKRQEALRRAIRRRWRWSR